MATAKVYGHSDDCIEVDTGNRRGDEFSAYNEPKFLHFADGTVLRVEYGDGGQWKIVRTKEGTAKFKLTECHPDDEDNYTDKAVLIGNVLPVECWSTEAGPTNEDLDDWFGSNFDADLLKLETKLAIYRLVKGNP